MNLPPIIGLLFVLFLVGLILYFMFGAPKRATRQVREIPAFTRLKSSIGQAVEAGTRLHISLGRGSLVGEQSAVAFAGLSVLDRIARAASISDRPPVATSGDSTVAILSQDTQRSAYRSLNAETQYDPTSGRVTGLTTWSYAAGVIPVIMDEQVSGNVIVGHVGSEAALITDAADRNGSMTIAGTDNLAGQAVLYAAAQDPLIGEEVFAGGAYLGAGPAHEASLRAQDVLRLLIIGVLVVASILNILGLGRLLAGLVGAP